MSVQLTPEQETELALLATLGERTSNDLAQEAVAHFLAKLHDEEVELTNAEEEAVRTGWLTHDEVFHRLKHRLSEAA